MVSFCKKKNEKKKKDKRVPWISLHICLSSHMLQAWSLNQMMIMVTLRVRVLHQAPEGHWPIIPCSHIFQEKKCPMFFTDYCVHHYAFVYYRGNTYFSVS